MGSGDVSSSPAVSASLSAAAPPARPISSSWSSVPVGHISCGPGSYYLQEESITIMRQDITTLAAAAAAVEELSAADPANSVVMWQLANPWSNGATVGSTPSDKQYLVAHKLK